MNKFGIVIFKIEYKYPGFKIPIIEYNLFGYYGTKKLNLYLCNNLKIRYYIPKVINNYEDYLYNPKNDYYNNECSSATYQKNIDLIINDRREEFNKNNMSLCESFCTYKEYTNNQIICECDVKHKFNSFLNINVSKYDLIHRF